MRTISRKGLRLSAGGILRDCTPDGMMLPKIQSELHGDMQSQAEMSWPSAGEPAGSNKTVGPYLPWALES